MTPADLAIQECLSERRSFLVDAGAGSGKTSSLIRAIRYIAEGTIGPALGRDAQKVACITYTKVARDEIIERTDHNPLGRFGAAVGVAVSGVGAVTGVVRIGAAGVSVVGANVIA